MGRLFRGRSRRSADLSIDRQVLAALLVLLGFGLTACGNATSNADGHGQTTATSGVRRCPWGSVLGEFTFEHPTWGTSRLVSCSNPAAPSTYGCSMQLFDARGHLRYESKDGNLGCETITLDASTHLPEISGAYNDGEPWTNRMSFDPIYPGVKEDGFAWEPVI